MNHLTWQLTRCSRPFIQSSLSPTQWPRQTSWRNTQTGWMTQLSSNSLPPRQQDTTAFLKPSRSGLELIDRVQSLSISASMPRDRKQGPPSDGEKQTASVHQRRSPKRPCDESYSSDYKKSKPAKRHERRKWVKRHWIPLADKADHGNGLKFSLMSYNVLAQDLLEEHAYMYSHCKPEFLTWEFRGKKLIDDIKHYNPDVICMQEVQGDHYYDFFVPQMKSLGYQGLYKKRTHEKVDGCATFFKERKFTLDLGVPVEYFNSKVRILDRDNVGLVILLKPRLPYVSPRKQQHSKQVDTDARLCVANTHLLFNPRRGDVKLAQLCVLLAEIDKVAAKPGFSGHHPIILCGDFNLCPRSPLYDFVCGKHLNIEQFSGQDLSWQKESQRGCPISLLPSTLPPRMGIFDQCQYVKEIARRHMLHKKGHERRQSSSETGGACAETTDETVCSMKANTLGTGVLSNCLNLVSVYGHETLRHGKPEQEITTKHGNVECIVDFMFYSVKHNFTGLDNRSNDKLNHLIEESNLKLLTKLDLHTQREAREIGGYPSKYYPSDHIPLMADFRLCY